MKVLVRTLTIPIEKLLCFFSIKLIIVLLILSGEKSYAAH